MWPSWHSPACDSNAPLGPRRPAKPPLGKSLRIVLRPPFLCAGTQARFRLSVRALHLLQTGWADQLTAHVDHASTHVQQAIHARHQSDSIGRHPDLAHENHQVGQRAAWVSDALIEVKTHSATNSACSTMDGSTPKSWATNGTSIPSNTAVALKFILAPSSSMNSTGPLQIPTDCSAMRMEVSRVALLERVRTSAIVF